jgi:hypothetical protein
VAAEVSTVFLPTKVEGFDSPVELALDMRRPLTHAEAHLTCVAHFSMYDERR